MYMFWAGMLFQMIALMNGILTDHIAESTVIAVFGFVLMVVAFSDKKR